MLQSIERKHPSIPVHLRTGSSESDHIIGAALIPMPTT